MVCPNCATTIDDNCETCYSCGLEFKHATPDEKPSTNNKEKIKKKPSFDKVKSKKTIFIACVALVVLICVIIFIISLFHKTGEEIAFKMSEKIGSNIVKIEKNAGVHVNTSSAYPAINKPADFDYIYESDKKIKVDGITVPEWAITLYATDSEITKIYYRDYTQQKKYYKGVKLKEAVEYSDLKECEKLKDIQTELDIDPISITFYDDKTTEYRYMFYYIDDDKNEVRKEYKVIVDSKNKILDIIETDFQEENNNIK